MREPWRIALVTQGFLTGGGVPTVARWLRSGLERTGDYVVDVHDLAMSSRDPSSRRITSPATWARTALDHPLDGSAGDRHWGANAVELEPMRYRPRKQLTRALAGYDLVQVVAGAPALAHAVLPADVPVVLQAATRARWERESQLAVASGPLRAWRRGMTHLVTRTERRALRGVDAVLVWNQAMLDSVRPHCRGHVGLAAPGVDTQRFRPHADGWQRHGPLLSVCRLAEPRKGLDRLVRAYARMTEVHPAVPELVLAGRGRLPDEVRQLIEQLELSSRVSVLSDVAVDELPALYQGASVFLQASHEEGFGVSVLEAMASGLPVVSTETAGSRLTVLDGRTGRLVPQGVGLPPVPGALAAATLQVLEHEGMAMSGGARQLALSAFSDQVTLARFMDVYTELLGAAPRSCVEQPTAMTSSAAPGLRAAEERQRDF